ncbi:MAG: CDP-glycerol glycerophosphotransferase family protein [Chlamydiae bacterium]|nr:CDP-glycerol glycerophosphotransferase family protein [Chlamydiota bacterium]
MKHPKVATLIYGLQLNYLDHLAPLSCLLNIDLITNEEKVAILAKKYYPDLKLKYRDYRDFNLFIAQEYDRIIYCYTRPFFDLHFSLNLNQIGKKIDTIWAPHGNSDKGHLAPYMQALATEESAIIYGNKMLDFIKEKKVLKGIKNRFVLGNFRKTYFLQNQKFYKKILKKELLPKIQKNLLTILYAPTWDDLENSCSFWNIYEELFSTLPPHYNLIVKLHPNTMIKHALQIEALQEKYSKKNIFFINDFPCIYPLLSLCDIYLGDMSSIGYDFLYFNKPMFFLNPNQRKDKGLYLFRCGHEIPNKKNIFSFMEEKLPTDKKLSKIRKEVYNYTFAKTNLRKLKNFILK